MRALMIRPVSPFAAATLIPVPLLVSGGLLGGAFILAAVLYMTLLALTLDRIVATAGPEAAPGVEFPAADRLSLALGILHFPLLALGVAALAGVTGLGLIEELGVLLAFGLYFGQVSNSNAHELIHRGDARRFRLGKWVLVSLLYGHHVTAHLRIHHRYVATPEDPNTAELGEGFYAFAVRAWLGSFVAGWEIENSIAQIRGKALRPWQHPYTEYLAGAAGFALLATLAFGASGLFGYFLLAVYAQAQLLISDYVQHYGLRRRMIDFDQYEPVAPWHSWNAPHWFSGGLMLNAPRHSEHHTSPSKPYPELSLPAEAEGPRLPYSLPAMGAIALVPPLWRQIMDHRATAWQKRIDEGLLRRSRPPEPLAPKATGPVPPSPEPPTPDPILADRGPDDPAPSEPKATARKPARRRRAAAEISAEADPVPEGATSAATEDAGADTELTPDLLQRIRDGEPPPPEPTAAERRRLSVEALAARTPDLWADPTVPDPGPEAPEDAPEPTQTARFVRSSALFQPEGEAAEGEPGLAAEAATDAAAQSDAVARGIEDATTAPDAEAPSTPGHPDVEVGSAVGALGSEVPAGPAPMANGGDTVDGAAAPVEGKDEAKAIDSAISEIVSRSRRDFRRLRAKFPALEPQRDPAKRSTREELRTSFAGAVLAARALAAVLRGGPPQPPEPDYPDFEVPKLPTKPTRIR